MQSSRKTFMPHQVAGFKWLKYRRQAALFWEMRLGKTLVAIRWAASRPNVSKRLVLSPLSVVPNWKRELEAEGHTTVALTGSAKDAIAAIEAQPDAAFYVANYEKMVDHSRDEHGNAYKRAKPSVLARLPWDVVVLDESTKIRNPGSKITKIAVNFLAQAEYRLLLTGLPNPEGPEDFATQMLFLNGGEFMGCKDFWHWRQKYMRPIDYSWSVTVKGERALKQAVRENAFFMTKKDANLGNVKIRETRYVDLPNKIVKAMDTCLLDFQVGDRLAMNKLQVISWLIQLAGGRYPDEQFHHDAKVNEVYALVTGELKDQPVVIWARHTAELLAVFNKLIKHKVSCAVAYGETNDTNAETVDAFRNGKVRVLIAQPKSFQMGHDFSNADVMIYFSNWHDCEIRLQSEERCEHPKKKDRPILIIDIAARDTYDEDVIAALRDKRIIASMFNKKLLKSELLSCLAKRQANSMGISELLELKR